ncbi:Matrix-remodeling-associated protein 5 [Camelus dromedarius]|uniref:Matrix-remodeling-associated protein 5 n=1 Tax=Camelus dromedarius TaxID=9838 RepID=A0A5N4C1J0_CAMDR|nr:Matrix-remodeling-associated protein 5 [Camelus dromedarius]
MQPPPPGEKTADEGFILWPFSGPLTYGVCVRLCVSGILKCKKDKAYEGGQLCSVCSSPEKLHKQEIQKLKDITCQKPSIESPLRQNRSRGSEEEQDAEEDSDNQFPLEGFQYPPWNVSLNMSDEHGNTVSLACDIKKPMDLYKIHLNQTDPQELEINATVALDFECPMTRETYEKLWKLIAYYSEVPVKLHRELALGKDPRLGYQYRQDADDDTLYYTGVRAHVLTEPEWVMQPSIHIQLNRRQSTAKTVLLSYSSQHALTVSAKDARQARSRSWVMIEPGRAVQRAQTVLEGSPCQLSCNVKASESPSIFWVFPDGSVLKAPVEDEHGRFSILTSGWLKIKSTEQSDAGLYQCIARVRGETDRMVYRVLVQTPATPPPDGHTVTVQKDPGESVMLPCRALAIPEAQISWILPNRRIVNDMANTSHAYMLADGTLSIPKVQGSDSGYYRCVAVNQQGADHFTVGVTVHKKGSGRSSKRGRRPGGKTLPGGRGDVVEDEGGSGMADGDNVSRTALLHPKDQEMSLKTEDDGGIPGGQKAKKGRRKMKPWKSSEKEPETNVAEGRRVFEARRRINVANKQINPEHWADILARVRGRNPPKGTEVPPVVKSTTLPAVSQQVTSLSPAVRAPSASPVRTATSVEESSGDAPFFGEEKQASSAVSSTKTAPVEHGHDGAIPAEPHVTSTRPEGLSDDEFSAKTKAEAPTAVDLKWAASTTAYQSSATRSSLGVVHGEPTTGNEATGRWSARDAGAEPERTPKEYESPLDATSLAESETVPSSYPDLKTNSAPGGAKRNDLTTTDVTAAPTPGVADSRMPEPLEDPTLGEPGVPAEAQLQEQTDDPQLLENGSSPQGHPLMEKGREGGSQTRRGGGLHEGDAVDSRSAESRRRGAEPSPPLDPALEVTDTVAPFQHPRGTTRGPLWDAGATTVATMLMPPQTATSPPALTSHASRKRPNGRRRLRPHRFRQRHRQNQPTTLAPGETFSAPPTTRVPEMQTPNQAASLPVPATAVDSTAGTAKQLDVEKHTEPASKGTYARRKHGKRPNKHRYPTSTDGPPASASKPSPAPEERHKHVVTPSSEAVPSSTAISLPTGGPREMSRVEDYRTTTTKVNLSHDKLQGTIPVSDGREIKNYEVTTIRGYETDRLVLGESITDVASPSGAEVSTVGGFKAGSCPFGFEGNASCNPPTSARPERLRTDRTVASSSKTLTDSPLLKELQDVDSPAEFSPLAATSALLPQEDVTTMRERKVNPGPYNRIHSQSVTHVDFGPPAPPVLHPPRTAAPPSTNVQSVPLVYSTRSPIPTLTPSVQPSRSFHQSSSKLFSAGGLPASKFWVPGEKPQIVTKFPQTVSVIAETDVVFPCEATGKPKPFVTWTKVSTGALMTPHTRVQRFEVLKNGTFVIRNVQVQDRGQYVCTAKNLHGADRMVVLLSVTVQQPQILASHYKDVTVYLGDTIAMECLAKGTPAPQISWIFPDRRVWQTVSPVEGRITLHENRTLSIKEASFADRGVYKCVASNAAGADSLAIRLHVAALPPVIHQERLENISLPPGLSIHIHCSAKAAPLPSVRWVLWDGTQIRPSQFVNGNLFVFPNGTLYIRNLAPKDSGRYECVAANLVGSARRTVQLTVQRAAANARITGTSPQRTDVRYGGTLQLDCSASGDPWPRILWRLPSKRMIDALFSFDSRIKVFANGTLVVKSVTDKDAGDYLCVARNKVGDDFVVLKVNVVMKPAKIEHKEENDHRVFYGGDLKVDCVATGLPNPEISWSLPDGSLVNSFVQSDDSGGRTKRYVVFNNGTLYFNEVGLREEGDYTCFAENQVGKDEMRVRVKVVTEPAAIRNKTYSVVHVPYGDVVTVACEAKGEPTPRKAQRSDSGNYTCVVRNSAGEDRKMVWIHVDVQPPKINGNPNAITTVREIAPGGSRKLIDCRAEGIPTPRVFWAFPEGVVLPAPYYGNRITIHRNGTLDMRSLRKSDSVQLACIGRNEGGEARLMVQLTVLEPVEKPVFHDPVSEKITAMAGHTISLNCSATGTPTPSLLWVLPNGTELQSGQQLNRFFHKGDGRLHISGLSSVDAGAYRCVARNSAGYTERLVSLKVGLKPETSNQYHNLVSIINGETLQLPCTPPGRRQARSSWTLPNGLVLEGPQTRGRFTLWENGTLTVLDASVFDRGTYVCKTHTEYGPSVVNVPVIVIAYPPRITSEPTPVIYTRPGSTVKMNCMAMGIPKAEITWELPDRLHLTAGTQARLYGNRFLHPQGSLTIQQATQRDAGFYKCTAKNILGSDSKTTYIHVY